MTGEGDQRRRTLPDTAPLTVPVQTRWWTPLDPIPRWTRLRDSWVAIVQITVAATAAYAFAYYVLGHSAPLLAATVTISSLGLVRDARPRRVLETVIGMLVGILVAEVLLLLVGSGWWQLAISLGATLAIARFLAPQPSFALAAAIQSIIVMIMPTNAPLSRLADGAVGAVAALLATALLPRSPLRTELRAGDALFAGYASANDTLIRALRRGDRLRAERSLEKARALQSPVDEWRVALESGRAIARIAPFLRSQRFEIARHERICHAMDYACRNIRVIARRSVYLTDDREPRPVAADVLADLARGADLLAQSLRDISLEPIAREKLRSVAARLDPRAILPDAGLGDQNLIAALRPLAVDLLAAAGMPNAEASAAVPRI
ncbi:FUSC family protein [Microbacterium sediminicola]|uniref:FUSC family protein n=1 Tax=Microbacterium sediminicola TaxID=415210 RepID=A0ABN2I4X0_9MICO